MTDTFKPVAKFASPAPAPTPLAKERLVLVDCPDCRGRAGQKACACCEGLGKVCRRCSGTGFVYTLYLFGLRVAPSEENLNNRDVKCVTEECPMCDKVQKRFMTAVALRWPVGKDFVALADAPIDALADRADLYSEAASIVNAFTVHWPGGVMLTFDGNRGTAKTHFLSRIYARAFAAGLSAIYVSGTVAERALSNFRDDDGHPQKKDLPDSDTTWSDFCKVDQLLLDEAEKITHRSDESGWAERNLFGVVDYRLQHGLSVVLAGNELDQKLHSGIRDRARAGDCRWIDFGDVTSARPYYSRHDRWWDDRQEG